MRHSFNTPLRNTLLLVALTLAGTLRAQDFHVKVTPLSPESADYCLLTTLNDTRTDALSQDSIPLTTGQGEASLTLGQVREAVFSLMKGEMATLDQYLILVPGDTLLLQETPDGWTFSGSEFYRQAGEIKSAINPLTTSYNASIMAMEEQKKAPEANADSITKEEWALYEGYRAAYVSAISDYASRNPEAEGVALMLPYAVSSAPEVANMLSERVRTLSPVAPIIQRIFQEEQQKKERAEAVERAKERVGEGHPAPEFTLNDLNGSPLSLASLRGKYVVLDFWGSWCGWCIKGIPRMKEYYTKYAGRFEILSIDCNDSPEKWMAAVAQYELPWLHVYNPSEGDITPSYAIQGYPTKIVVDPEGNIAKVIVGESDDFYEYLDQLFGE